MSNTSVYAASSEPRSERRRDTRHSVITPVYLDVGADNGGILLNVSEQGIGFVAIAPLDGQGKVTLRIQFASTRPQIETSAQIVWFDRSNRQTGVRFVGMSPQLRAQVHDWIGSESVLSAPETEIPEQPSVLSEPQLERDTAHGSADEATSLIEAPLSADIGASGSLQAAPEVEASFTESLPQSDFGMFEKPAEVPADGGQQLMKEPTAFAEPPVRKPDGQPKAHSERDDLYPSLSASALTVSTPDHAEILDWPIPSSRIMPAPAPLASTESLRSVQSPAYDRDLQPEPVAIGWSDTPVVPTRTEPAQVRKWIWATALLAFFSILCLCFGIGMWVKAHRRQSVRLVATSPPVTNESPQAKNVPARPAALAGSVSSKGRAEHREKKREAGSEKLTASQPAADQGTEPLNPVPQPLPLQQAVPPALTTSVQSAPTLQPPPVDSIAPAPVQKIVAGRSLKLTDRFNPCHLTYRVEPVYPSAARERGIEGTVRIRQVIGTDGTVRSVKLLGGPPELAAAALDAARYWRYLPAVLNGQGVETDQDIEIEFRLPR